jgi:dihydroorotate dehydrogenase (fumarate)
MDLSTTYLGLKLSNPIVPSASPLSREVGSVRALEDAGAAAIVMESLFEEQITHEVAELAHYLDYGKESFSEALSYFPEKRTYILGPDEYLNHVRRLKEAVRIPVIASLNGDSLGGWIDYALKIQQAGADALELNIYSIPTDPAVSSAEVEQTYVDILKAVKSNVKIPVALKLSPFFTTVAHVATRFDEAGADALVLFNRFYQPDIDLEALEVVPHVLLSTPQAMRLPMRWIAILYGRIKADLAATSGIETAEDVLKMLMVGSSITMMASALFRNGAPHISKVLQDMQNWMAEHEYHSVKQMQGSMSQKHCHDPAAFERANYMMALKSFR